MYVGGSIDNYLLINPNSAISSTRYWVTKRHFRLGMFKVKFLTTHLPNCSFPGPSLPRNWRLIPPGVWARAVSIPALLFDSPSSPPSDRSLSASDVCPDPATAPTPWVYLTIALVGLLLSPMEQAVSYFQL